MSLVVDTFVVGPAQENCYVVRATSNAAEAVVVDPGDDGAQLRLELARLGTRCVGILVTHCHWDHLGAVADLAEAAGAPVYMAREEAPVLVSPDDFYGALGIRIRPYTPDELLDGGER
ncbi:MAG TPA: MBL fold metallo-hydrolase, partial [Gaiellaceae bacterium]